MLVDPAGVVPEDAGTDQPIESGYRVTRAGPSTLALGIFDADLRVAVPFPVHAPDLCAAIAAASRTVGSHLVGFTR
jgi:hypothetical protein